MWKKENLDSETSPLIQFKLNREETLIILRKLPTRKCIVATCYKKFLQTSSLLLLNPVVLMTRTNPNFGHILYFVLSTAVRGLNLLFVVFKD